MVPFSFANQDLRLGSGRALYWAEEQALLVADLHLEKASYFARFGQMLPPYDSRETLERVAEAIRETGARRVFCLGDNFHDAQGAERLEPHAAGMLDALSRATDWVWITGNHDVKGGKAPGTFVDELDVRGLLLRHEARPGETRPELSGHFHPKLRITARGRRIARPCVVASERKLILPAFGALTGGMDAGDPAILAAMQPARAIDALVPAAGRLARFPLWRESQHRA
ncbi:ligase-associated DNA damage response endonuclease PdeM [Novosphingobium sp. KCTC 2891]|uniref:ligase-associated DNA damage response endonuclease PdeM n=1 Tax=Novosphingobium sp. KCTC 2891 TaxID=2989730 RepID=UPI00222140FD|nr:ligase-associated DNA damage response endonuclease PdeM [Novosphingobium sp. KCTC 2891]MCW1381483.1 ligase-associated DNA damage response endonuclease PdeM [Novosphingobium sp. KCTC 2891]